MKTWHSRLIRYAFVPLVALAALMISCRAADQATGPQSNGVSAARGGGSGGPAVTSVVPDNSPRAVTLDVTVNGSGFDQGSVARLERQGVPAAKITTNTTTFLTPKKLIANITIAADADTGKYDVAVLASDNRKGVGIELFTVTYVIDELGVIGGTWSRAHAINDQGEVVGASCTQDCLGTGFYWTDAGGLVDLGTMPGYSRSAAHAITNRSEVFGAVECRAADPGCGGVFKTALVRWDRVGGIWTITPVEGCSVVRPAGDASDKFLINNNNQCVKLGSPLSSPLRVQTLSGGTVVSEETLPSAFPGGSNQANAISDAPMVAGSATSTWPQPVIWYRNAAGTWVVLQLGLPGTDTRGFATDIGDPNVAGRVLVSGYAENTNARHRQSAPHPVRWTLQADALGAWQVASIELLPTTGQTGGYGGSWAIAVNNAGDAGGMSNGFIDQASPVVWPVGGGVQKLPTISGASGFGRVLDINNQGWIVGSVFDQSNACDRAAIWRQR